MSKENPAFVNPMERTYIGFWTYLMTDCILFLVLFVTYIVLHNRTHGGPTSVQLFELPFVLGETMLLLTSSFTCGLAMLRRQRGWLLFWFAWTFLLGAGFLVLELSEFTRFVEKGYSWQHSAFLSAFFTLVGTHGLHVTIGLLFMIVLLVPVMRGEITARSIKRLTCLRLFWHFLDLVWIFIFTIVYLMGVG